MRLVRRSGFSETRWRRIRMTQRLIWIVSSATALQTALQGLDAAMQGSWSRFTLWMAGSFAIAPLAAWAERIKGADAP